MLLWFCLGLVLLVVGADLLVRGAARLATAVGMSPLVVGLTVVAFGTSAPELAVSTGSAWSGGADLAVGNVVGSNIFNLLLILGLAALITPLEVARQLVRRDVPLMVLLSAVAFGFALDGRIDRFEGLLLLLGLLGYTTSCIRSSRRESTPADVETAPGHRGSWPRDLLLVLAGLGLLVLGADWLVDAAVDFARWFGVSEVVVGLTIVAAGTSLPEAATSVVAAMRGQRDIAVGNAVGSNLFNLTAVLGSAAMVAEDGLPVAESVRSFDLPVMLAAAVACLPIFATGHRIDRWEGGLFLGYFVAYTAYVVLEASYHDALAEQSWVMTAFVVPLVLVTLLVMASRARRRRPADGTSD